MCENMDMIRETSRNVLLLNRRRHRDEETDLRRAVDGLSVSTASVAQIVDRLRKKSVISESDLQLLKNAIISDSSNIEMFLKSNGALRGLVREMTGHDVGRKCAAAGCYCNLSLGDERAGAALTKAAGLYLVADLDNRTTDLAITCAWTIGNLAGSGDKACSLLLAQGAVMKLTQLLAATNEDIQDAAMYALVHVVNQLKDDLSMEHLEKIIQALSQLQITQTSTQLLFLLSCHANFLSVTISEEFVQKILETLPVSIDKYLSNTDIGFEYTLRSLANMNVGEIYTTVLEYFTVNNIGGVFKVLLDKDVSASLLWMLGNMFNYCNNHVFFVDFLR